MAILLGWKIESPDFWNSWPKKYQDWIFFFLFSKDGPLFWTIREEFSIANAAWCTKMILNEIEQCFRVYASNLYDAVICIVTL